MTNQQHTGDICENEKLEQAVQIASERCASAGAELTVLSVAGSRLYGLGTESSDTDLRGVFLPSLRDSVLGDVRKSMQVSSPHPETGKGGKDSSPDTDIEIYSADFFLASALKGQPWAFELLFTPAEKIFVSTELWDSVLDGRDLFLSRRIRTFLLCASGYAAQSDAGASRVRFLKTLRSYLHSLSPEKTLGDVSGKIISIDRDCSRDGEGRFLSYASQHDGRFALSLSGKKFPLEMGAKQFLSFVENALARHVKNGRRAEGNPGDPDWKSLSHAFRVLYQARCLIRDGGFSFPLPEAPFLMEIKTGGLLSKRQELYAELAELTKKTETEIEQSNLPEEPSDEAIAFAETVRMDRYFRETVKRAVPHCC